MLNNINNFEEQSIEKGVIPMFGDNFTYNEMTFDASQGYEFHGQNGTHLSIPKSAFVDKDGRTVNGKVKVKFRNILLKID